MRARDSRAFRGCDQQSREDLVDEATLSLIVLRIAALWSGIAVAEKTVARLESQRLSNRRPEEA